MEEQGKYNVEKAEGPYPLAVMAAMSLNEARTQLALLQTFVKEQMRDGEDFGTIPGTQKPTLYKAGAEKLANLYGLAPFPVPVDTKEDWDKGFFYYRYRVELTDRRSGQVVGACEGSANSKEKKYRYRHIPDYKASEDEKAQAVKKDKRKGQYGDWYMLTLENDDPYTLVNTLQKMAQKRAMVGAALIACRASGIFTQDVEDMEIIDAEFHVVESEPKKTPKPKPSGNGGDKPEPAAEVPASAWNERSKLIQNITNTVPRYINNSYAAIKALHKLEKAGSIEWGMSDDDVLVSVEAHAAKRDKEKA